MAVQLGPITRAEALSRLDSQPVIIRRYVAHLVTQAWQEGSRSGIGALPQDLLGAAGGAVGTFHVDPTTQQWEHDNPGALLEDVTPIHEPAVYIPPDWVEVTPSLLLITCLQAIITGEPQPYSLVI